APIASAADNETGYIVFTRDYLNPIFYNSVPVKNELKKEAGIFASLGEYESVQIGVYPLKDLQGVKVEVSDFTNGKDTLSSSNFDVRWVRYMAGAASIPTMYIMQPESMEKFTSVDIKDGITSQFWVTVKVPEDAKPGNYTGKASISAANGKTSEVAIKLEVMPFKLDKPETYFGFWYGNHDPEQLKKELKVAREFNISCTVGYNPSVSYKNGKVTIIDTDKYIQLLKIHKDMGVPVMDTNISQLGNTLAALKVQWFSQEFNEAVKDWSLQMLKIWKDNGFGDLYVNVFDEPRPENLCRPGINISYEDTLKYLQLLKQIPGVKTVVTLAGPEKKFDPEILKYMDRTQPHLGANFKEHMKMAREMGKEIIVYNNGYSSLAWGFCVWKCGAKGNFQWFLEAYSADDNAFAPIRKNPEYEGQTNTRQLYPTKDGFIPSVRAVYIREGGDDYKYIVTLENMIAKLAANKDAETAVKEAKKVVEETRAKVPDYPKAGIISGYETGEGGMERQSSEILLALRYKIGQQIAKLSKF
ncbi:MAG: glycoside hydrolase domain-containing protein, partial [Candidatus Firestonebacteria bacterium]